MPQLHTGGVRGSQGSQMGKRKSGIQKMERSASGRMRASESKEQRRSNILKTFECGDLINQGRPSVAGGVNRATHLVGQGSGFITEASEHIGHGLHSVGVHLPDAVRDKVARGSVLAGQATEELAGGLRKFGSYGSDMGSWAAAELRENTDFVPSKSFHEAYFWVPTEQDACDHEEIDPEVVVTKFGLPLEILMLFISDQIQAVKNFMGMPAAALLVLSFAFMSMAHEKGDTVWGMKSAIDADIQENANFAFADPGAMGFKGLQDVNSYADFWSWTRLGLAPLLFKTDLSVSEAAPGIDLGDASTLDRQFYLWTSRMIGGLELRQSVRKTEQCESVGKEIFGQACHPSHAMQTIHREPEEFEIVTVDFKVAEDFTVLLHQDPGLGIKPLQQKLLQLEKDHWLNADSEHVQLRFLMFNAPLDVLTLTNIHLILTQSGHMWKDITYITIVTSYHETWVALLWDILFFGQVTWICASEGLELLKNVCRHGREFLRQYCTFWNFVDWASVGLGYVILVFWVKQIMHKHEITDKLVSLAHCHRADSMPTAQCYTESSAMLVLMDEINPILVANRAMCAVYVLIIVLRLFKAFSGQPRMAVVVNTIMLAWVDVYHFSIVFGSFFLSSAIAGNVLFGREAKEFLTVGDAAFSCLRLLFGDFDSEQYAQVNLSGTMIFFVVFMSIFVLVLLNMVIAILLEAGFNAKSQSGSSETLVRSVQKLVLGAGKGVGVGASLWCWTGVHRIAQRTIFKNLKVLLANGNVREATLVLPETFQAMVPGLGEEQATKMLTQAAQWHYLRMEVSIVNETDIMQAWANVATDLRSEALQWFSWSPQVEREVLQNRLQKMKEEALEARRQGKVVSGQEAVSAKGALLNALTAEELAGLLPMKTLLQAAKLRLEADAAVLAQPSGSTEKPPATATILKHQLLAAKASYLNLEGVLRNQIVFKI